LPQSQIVSQSFGALSDGAGDRRFSLSRNALQAPVGAEYGDDARGWNDGPTACWESRLGLFEQFWCDP
jgi:hypothetical protein